MKQCLPFFLLFFVTTQGFFLSAMQKESGYVECPFGRMYYQKNWYQRTKDREPVVLCVDRRLEGPEDFSDIALTHPVLLCTFMEVKKIAMQDPYFLEKTAICFKEQLDFESFYVLGCFNELPTLGYYDPGQKSLISCVNFSEKQFGVVGWAFGVKEILESLKVRGRQQGRILNFSIDEERLEIMDYFFSGNFPWASFIFVDKPSQ